MFVLYNDAIQSIKPEIRLLMQLYHNIFLFCLFMYQNQCFGTGQTTSVPKTVLRYDVDKDLPRSDILLSSPNLVSKIKVTFIV